MMLPVERQNRIKALVRTQKNIKISELSEALDVSEMTIHRDLKPLIEEGFVEKTFGGIILTENDPPQIFNEETCSFCNKRVHEPLSYRLMLSGGRLENTCCPHCGLLRHQQLGQRVNQAVCHDFLRHTTIHAVTAWFVMDTSLDIGCCGPQVLSFEQKDHAQKFIKGFGGMIYTFSGATQSISQRL